ncbi:hypothetical protein PsYK624_171810 [Phanerochaete sordida]|uniref:Uncharacterized protein n=1 Tax=Phanerochaete sordida TaxID=48140 RepID=A0A9P3GS88_9APHY|nr:hypothetical protein PsYK624_171810 [Phanerochaete sordida]
MTCAVFLGYKRSIKCISARCRTSSSPRRALLLPPLSHSLPVVRRSPTHAPTRPLRGARARSHRVPPRRLAHL